MIKMRHRESYVKSKTAEYDEQAMQYLAWVMYPCILGYAFYSMYYNEHKGWYSFVLNTLVGCVYTFGFIMMYALTSSLTLKPNLDPVCVHSAMSLPQGLRTE